MLIGIPRETQPGETRVAATPETVKKMAASGAHVIVVEEGAGQGSSIPEADYVAAGATIGAPAAALGADLVLKVRAPTAEELPKLKSGACLIGILNPFDAAGVAAIAATGVTAFALEALPRISRAQSMDVLSSQANLAGYRAVIEAAESFGRAFPMMMTAGAPFRRRRCS